MDKELVQLIKQAREEGFTWSSISIGLKIPETTLKNNVGCKKINRSSFDSWPPYLEYLKSISDPKPSISESLESSNPSESPKPSISESLESSNPSEISKISEPQSLSSSPYIPPEIPDKFLGYLTQKDYDFLMWPQTAFDNVGAKIKYRYEKQQLINKVPLKIRQELIDIVKVFIDETFYLEEENF